MQLIHSILKSRRATRQVTLFAAVLATATLAVALVPNGASAATFQPGKVYYLATGHTLFAKVYDVEGISTANHTHVNQYQFNGGLNQRWLVIQSGSTTFGTPAYSLIPRHAPDKCLDIPAASTAPGTDAQIFTCHFGTNQQFFISPVSGTDAFRITARHSGLTLEVENKSLANGARVQQNLGPNPPSPLPPHQQVALVPAPA